MWLIFLILNRKVFIYFNLELLIEKNLEKCPDKNAKLTLELTGYMKQEIKPDAVSHKSNKSDN